MWWVHINTMKSLSLLLTIVDAHLQASSPTSVHPPPHQPYHHLLFPLLFILQSINPILISCSFSLPHLWSLYHIILSFLLFSTSGPCLLYLPSITLHPLSSSLDQRFLNFFHSRPRFDKKFYESILYKYLYGIKSLFFQVNQK